MSDIIDRGKIVLFRNENTAFAFREKISINMRFSWADQSLWNGSPQQISFISVESENFNYIGIIKKGKKPANSGNLFFLNPVFAIPGAGVPFSVFLDRLPSIYQETFIQACSIKYGSVADLPPKAFEAVLNVFIKWDYEMLKLIERLKNNINRSRPVVSGRAGEILAMEQEATYTGLKMGGIDPEIFSSDWVEPDRTTFGSFLDGFKSASLREDAMIQYDHCTLPGWEQIERNQVGVVAFECKNTRVEIIHANRTPLEHVLGVDLIYVNQLFKSLIMVQYKVMRNENGKPRFRLPNYQLDEEISRMRRIENILCRSPDLTPDGFRLNQTPFYLKFCPKIVFDPSDSGLIKGMYLHLDHWQTLSTSGVLNGPQGGMYLAYENAGRWFDNTTFIDLTKAGWIGSAGMNSIDLWNIVNELIESGRSVTVAAKTNQLLMGCRKGGNKG
ncbi:MAG: hypothetical protein HQM03_11600 [Magnetococcales bacterium]|nr:hypothetical protein [Magnetococcales bacterium]